MLRSALRYARQRAVLVRRSGARIDNLYPRELVQDALADTWIGEVVWDPTRCSLLDHIRGVIRSRSWKDAIGARRFRHFCFGTDDSPAAREVDEAQRHGTVGNVSPIVLAGLTASVTSGLQRLAQGDRAATAILGAWAAGLTERDEVMLHTGLSGTEYKAARARLTYLVMSLPQSLREVVRVRLRSAS